MWLKVNIAGGLKPGSFIPALVNTDQLAQIKGDGPLAKITFFDGRTQHVQESLEKLTGMILGNVETGYVAPKLADEH